MKISRKRTGRAKKPLVSIHKDLLKLLSSLKCNKRSKLIKLLKKEQINSISEIFANFLRYNLTRCKRIIKKAYPYRALIRRISLKNIPVTEKKRLLTSTRGGSILGILLPAAITLISKLFN